MACRPQRSTSNKLRPEKLLERRVELRLDEGTDVLIAMIRKVGNR